MIFFHFFSSHGNRFLPNYVNAFERDQLEDDILPQILKGIRDTNDDLVAGTLHALAHLVPLMGANYVIGGKHRKKLFFDGHPGSKVLQVI